MTLAKAGGHPPSPEVSRRIRRGRAATRVSRGTVLEIGRGFDRPGAVVTELGGEAGRRSAPRRRRMTLAKAGGHPPRLDGETSLHELSTKRNSAEHPDMQSRLGF